MAGYKVSDVRKAAELDKSARREFQNFINRRTKPLFVHARRVVSGPTSLYPPSHTHMHTHTIDLATCTCTSV